MLLCQKVSQCKMSLEAGIGVPLHVPWHAILLNCYQGDLSGQHEQLAGLPGSLSGA